MNLFTGWRKDGDFPDLSDFRSWVGVSTLNHPLKVGFFIGFFFGHQPTSFGANGSGRSGAGGVFFSNLC